MPASLGPYRLQGKLGQGGMGAVYRGVHETLERPVAVKILPAALASNPEYVARFLREARLIATLRHDNVVQVYDAGVQDDQYYIAMEFIDGFSLAAYLEKQGCLEEREGLALLLQAARGLAAAHQKGLIHRDVKPDNLLLDQEARTLRLVDFGLVVESTSNTQLTATGVCLGTPQYMSPEQADGEQADERTDIYSLGVTFFRAFTGQPPFDSPTVMNLLFKHKFEAPPDPRSLNPRLSPALCNLILTMMAKNREDRPASAEAVCQLILEIQAGGEIPQPPVFHSPLAAQSQAGATAIGECGAGSVREPLRPWVLVAAGLAGLGLVLLGGWAAFNRSRGVAEAGAQQGSVQGSGEGAGSSAAAVAISGAPEGGRQAGAGGPGPSAEQRQRLLVQGAELEGQGKVREALEAYRAAGGVEGDPALRAKVQKLSFAVLCEEARRLELAGDLEGALARAQEAQRWGDAAELVQTLQLKSSLLQARTKAQELERQGQHFAAADRYRAAGLLAVEESVKADCQAQERSCRARGYLEEGARAEQAKELKKAVESLERAQVLQPDAQLAARIEQLRGALAREEGFRERMQSGERGLKTGREALGRRQWVEAERQFTNAHKSFLEAYDLDGSGPLPGQRMKEAEALQLIVAAERALGEGDSAAALRKFRLAQGVHPPLAAEIERRMAAIPRPAVPDAGALAGEIRTLTSQGRFDAALAKVEQALVDFPERVERKEWLELRSALVGYLAFERLQGALETVFTQSLGAIREAEQVDSLGNYLRLLGETLTRQKEEGAEARALTAAKVRNGKYTGMEQALRDVRELSGRLRVQLEDTRDRYQEKAQRLRSGENKKVPLFGWKVVEPTPEDKEKAARLERIAGLFGDLAKKVREADK